jgi:antibiotic biosynthesis monooxygenase (ABM) superfamily enzyme
LLDAPVTVTTAHQVAPGHEEDFQAWADGMLQEAAKSRNYLGGGVISPGDGGGEWHVVYRWSDQDAALRWEGATTGGRPASSGDRERSADRAARAAKFLESGRPAPVRSPPTWKLALVTLAAVFPPVFLINVTVIPYLGEVSVVLRTLALCVAVTAIVTWVMPNLMRLLTGWLNRTAPKAAKAVAERPPAYRPEMYEQPTHAPETYDQPAYPLDAFDQQVFPQGTYAQPAAHAPPAHQTYTRETYTQETYAQQTYQTGPQPIAAPQTPPQTPLPTSLPTSLPQTPPQPAYAQETYEQQAYAQRVQAQRIQAQQVYAQPAQAQQVYPQPAQAQQVYPQRAQGSPVSRRLPVSGSTPAPDTGETPAPAGSGARHRR